MPTTRKGTINDDFVLNIDLASTILGAARIPQQKVMQGRDMADLYVHEKAADWRQEFFYEHPVHLHKSVIPASTALVRKDFKYMTWPDYGVEQLFQLKDDPLELTDLIGSKAHGGIVDEMRQRHNELKDQAL